MKELPIPPEAMRAPQARELARIWAANGKQHVSLATGLWDDPAAWGVMLVDLARHIANAYEIKGATSRTNALVRIRSAFDAEWLTPTDDPIGQLDGP